MNSQEKQFQKIVVEFLNEFSRFDLKKVLRIGQTFEFTDLIHRAEHTFQLLQTVAQDEAYYSLITQEECRYGIDFLPKFLNNLKSISSYDPERSNNANDQKQDLTNRFLESYKYLRENVLIPLESYLSNRQDEILKMNLKKKFDEVLDISTKARNVLNTIEETAEKIGTAKHAKIFDEQSKKYFRGGLFFLIISVISTYYIGSFLIQIFDELVLSLKNVKSLELGLTLQVFFSKIIIVSFFSFVLYQLYRNYNVQMHLAALNRHRANSLQTFKIFVESSENPQIKDRILVQATKSIFEAGDTGFITGKEQSAPPGIEVLGGFAKDSAK